MTGFTPGAVSLADTQSVARFTFDESGLAAPNNAHAIALMPATSHEPPFAPQSPPLEAAETVTPAEATVTYDLADWLECPKCATTHHRAANFCRSCGSKLHVDETGEAPPEPDPAAAPPQPAAGNGPPSPLILPGATAPSTVRQTVLRCRTCGSHDIELLRP